MTSTPPPDPWADDMPRDPAMDPYGQHPWEAKENVGSNHGLGLAALIIGVTTWVLGGIPFIYLIALGMMAEVNGDTLAEDDPRLIFGGCGLLLGMLLALIGTGLGIAGCCISGRKKLFAIIGLAASASFLLITLALMLLGLAIG